MIYKCRNCAHKEWRGILPATSCGMLLFLLMGIAAGLLAFILPKGFIQGLGGWKWLAIPILPVAVFLIAFIMNLVLEAIEWLAYCRRKCPQCGCRRWTWGFTEGFGL